MFGIGVRCGLSCMPACCAVEDDDIEFIEISQKPTLHDAADLEKIESPVLGYAVALAGDSGKIRELENAMTDPGNISCDEVCEGDFMFRDFDGLSTLYDSMSDVSDDISIASSGGEMGPEDLVVVGRGLLASSSSGSFAGSIEEVPPIGVTETANDIEQDKFDATTHQQPPIEQHRSSGWWSQADVAGVRGLEEASQLTTLLDARVVKSKNSSNAPAPWEAGQSSELYTAMGMVDPSRCYLAIWLNLGTASLLCVQEFQDPEWMDTCMEDNFLSQRLKFISNPVRMRGAGPSKLPKDAETVGAFFGKRGTSSTRSVTGQGVPYVCIQVDVFSKWYVKIGFQQVALRAGNILELLLVDGQSSNVLAGSRINVTPEFLELIAA